MFRELEGWGLCLRLGTSYTGLLWTQSGWAYRQMPAPWAIISIMQAYCPGLFTSLNHIPIPSHLSERTPGLLEGGQWALFLLTHGFTSVYCSWGSQGKNTEVVCHSHLQWTTFCQNSPPWPAHLEWPHTAWLSFIELEKAVVHVFRLASFLWLWFQCVCPLMISRNTYCPT